jgi:hypothetical protein
VQASTLQRAGEEEARAYHQKADDPAVAARRAAAASAQLVAARAQTVRWRRRPGGVSLSALAQFGRPASRCHCQPGSDDRAPNLSHCLRLSCVCLRRKCGGGAVRHRQRRCDVRSEAWSDEHGWRRQKRQPERRRWWRQREVSENRHAAQLARKRENAPPS